MKIYTDITQYDSLARNELFPVLKPYLGKATGFSNEACLAQYGFELSTYQIVEEGKEATLWILPMSWNYYRAKGKIEVAEKFVNRAAVLGKKVISFTSGDFGVKVPAFNNLIVYRQSGNKSRLPKYHHGMPVFIGDPLQKWFQQTAPEIRELQENPVIGFCGQTNDSVLNAMKEITRVWIRNVKFKIGRVLHEPQELLSSSYLRGRVLKIIKKASDLEANFIERKKYRAGASDELTKKQTTQEFYQNMVDSDYVICVRGGGNFSVRFYETLAMGRIPIFINTDCLLPFEDEIDWKKHVVWIESNELELLEEKIKTFHKEHTSQSFKALQKANRKLWEEKLRLKNVIKAPID
ncbi:exostosin family protein [Ascidiimonas sp. W6]|uniref:exostosin domain-containing protein n=1 Tax=Ascidiimonas meishanensis TaxID=3128903 RepID=UPI0030EC3662